MEEKESYTPREVAEICRAYLRTHKDGSTTAAEIERYERIVPYEGSVPKNVRDVINQLSSLEKMAFRKARDRL